MKQKLLLTIFALIVSFTCLGQASAYQPPSISACTLEPIDLTQFNSFILGNQNPAEYTVGFFWNETDAEANTNPIGNPETYVSFAPGSQSLYVRVTNNSNGDHAQTDLLLTVMEVPEVEDYPDVMVCDAFVLPALTPALHYYTGPFATGVELFAGMAIFNSGTIYVYSSNGICSGEDSFTVTVAMTPVLPPMPDVFACDMYMLPPLTVGEYYYDASGMVPVVNGIITTTQTVYAIASLGPCSYNESFTVTITPSPIIVSAPQQQIVACAGSAVLLTVEALGENLSYHWELNGAAIPGAAENTLTATQSGMYSCIVSSGTSIENNGPGCNAQVITNVLIGEVSINGGSPDFCPGSPFTLNVGPVMGPATTYQWQFNGEDLPLANSPTYTDPQASFSDSGVYSCVLTTPGCDTPYIGSMYVTIGGPFVGLQPMVSCFENGMAVYNLASISLQFDPQTVTIGFYESLDDAQNNPGNYITSINAYVTTEQSHVVYVRIENSGSQCPSISVLELIGQECTNNKISGTIRFDPEANGCSDTDNPAPNIQVTRIHGNDISYAYTNNDGYYEFLNVEEGTQQLYVQNLPSGLAVSYPPPPSGYVFNIVGNDAAATGNFCIGSAGGSTDATVYLYPMNAARPGFEAAYVLYVFNNGTSDLGGNLSLNYDVSKLDFIMATPSITSQITNTLNFNIDILHPFQSRFFYVYFTVKTPPTVNAGDVLTFDANMDTVALDANLQDNVAVINQTVVNSYDPNDIAVQQGSYILQNQANDYLNYTIRFQNTGTAEAINVKVITELDAKLDWSTFRPVASNYGYTAERNGNMVVFTYNGINLPASSVDEAGSNGYITFKVKPKSTLALGDIIAATADIYFDFNAPITTNTVTTELVSLLGVGQNDFSQLEMYPNPAAAKVTLRFNEALSQTANINIYDIQGKLIMENNNVSGTETNMDVSDLQSGLYFVKIVSGNQSAVRKLIVK